MTARTTPEGQGRSRHSDTLRAMGGPGRRHTLAEIRSQALDPSKRARRVWGTFRKWNPCDGSCPTRKKRTQRCGCVVNPQCLSPGLWWSRASIGSTCGKRAKSALYLVARCASVNPGCSKQFFFFHSVRVVAQRSRGSAALSIEGAIRSRRSAHAGSASGAIGGIRGVTMAKSTNRRTKCWLTSPFQRTGWPGFNATP